VACERVGQVPVRNVGSCAYGDYGTPWTRPRLGAWTRGNRACCFVSFFFFLVFSPVSLSYFFSFFLLAKKRVVKSGTDVYDRGLSNDDARVFLVDAS